MRIVVTGGAGFLGSHLVHDLLKEGHEVQILDNLENGKQSHLPSTHEKMQFAKVDISTDSLSQYFKDAQAVVHLAGFSSVLSSIENPQKAFRVNVVGAERVLSAAVENNVHVFINANSAEAMFGKSLNLPYDERASFDLQSPFAGTKAAFECYLAGFVRGLKSQNNFSSDTKASNYFTWISFRIPHVYGARSSKFNEAPFVGYCLDSLSRGLAPQLAQEGQRSRDYCSAGDVSRAFVMALQKAFETNLDDVFNLGSGQEVRDIEIFEMLKHAIQNKSLEVEDAKIFAKALTVNEPKFGPLKDYEPSRSFVNSTRSQAFFGWKPTQKIHDAIPELVDQFFSLKT
jgi:UDP-glucose 4-epimerase